MNEITKKAILREAGLSSQDFAVYSALLEAGSSPAKCLISQVKLPRTRLYAILDGLIAKGLITPDDRGTVRYFVPASPLVLQERIRRRTDELLGLRSSFDAEMPELLQAYQRASERPVITVEAGPEPVRRYYREAIEPRGQLRIFVAAGRDRFPDFAEILDEAILLQKKNQMRVRTIQGWRSTLPERDQYLKLIGERRVECRIVPGLFDLPGQIFIAKNFVAFTSFGKDLITSIIRHPDYQATMVNIFDSAWALGEPVSRSFMAADLAPAELSNLIAENERHTEPLRPRGRPKKS